MSNILQLTIKNNPKSKISKLWYVIYVRSKHEKNVHTALLNKGIESSLPITTITSALVVPTGRVGRGNHRHAMPTSLGGLAGLRWCSLP